MLKIKHIRRMYYQQNHLPIIGICGGVGPMAGCHAQQIILKHTQVSGDEGHLTTVHINDASNIMSRMAYLHHIEEHNPPTINNPGKDMAKVAINISKLAKASGRTCICQVPCNTYHVLPIYDAYLKDVMDYNTAHNKPGEPGDIKLMHLIDVCVEYASMKGYKSIGLTGTNFTKKYGLYRTPFEKSGFNVYDVDDQAAIDNAIHNKEWGVKALSKAGPESRKIMENAVNELVGKGAECVILGCSELPIIMTEKMFRGAEMIDPMEAMARMVIKSVDPTKLKPEDQVTGF